MKHKIILHIPHSSLKYPSFFAKKVNIEKHDLDEFNRQITDLYTQQLFSYKKFKSIVFPCSRIFCDVEKFEDDEKESMSKFGMGVVYTKTNDGTEFFKPSQDYKKKIIEKIYKPYHKKFTQKCQNYINNNSKIILVDCHSFSKEIIKTKIDKKIPDICLGINENHNNILLQFVQNYFVNLGYSVDINYPYSGAMLPNDINSSQINCIMIEINKSLYLKNNKKNKQFKILKKQIYGCLKLLKNLTVN